jgi:DNA-directed RNA polymerase subunit RPC12/RpoP
MSEFRFLCPVCGQHIATDSSASGSQIECPTCFQKIIVPQAPRADSKYILSATQYIKPQSVLPPPSPAIPGVSTKKGFMQEVFVPLFFVCVVAVAIYVVHKTRSGSGSAQTPADATNSVDASGVNKGWSLNLAGAAFPDDAAVGRLHNKDFICGRALFQNGLLALRQGSFRQPEAFVNVYLSPNETRELDGKRFDIRTNDSGTSPRIVLRWKEDDLRVTQTFTNGYAMKLEFGQSTAGMVPGKIYLCMPDASKSFVAGTFTAEIRNLSSPKQQ